MPLIVGTIHSRGALRRALKLRCGEVDFLELRVDQFASNPELLLEAAPHLAAPLIITVRHSAEGGAGTLSPAQRRILFTEFLPVGALLDVELRSVETHAEVIACARARGMKLIVSDHHFQSTPPLERLRRRLARARAAGADIVKVAALTSTAADVTRLLALFSEKGRPSLSVMGMGRLGKVSRLLFACAGSALNYGYLDQAQTPGQWEARKFKARLAEVTASDGESRSENRDGLE